VASPAVGDAGGLCDVVDGADGVDPRARPLVAVTRRRTTREENMKRQDTYIWQDDEKIARHAIQIVDERLSHWEAHFPDGNSELTCPRFEFVALCEIARKYLAWQDAKQAAPCPGSAGERADEVTLMNNDLTLDVEWLTRVLEEPTGHRHGKRGVLRWNLDEQFGTMAIELNGVHFPWQGMLRYQFRDLCAALNIPLPA
jgi:hypothetical protein